MNMEKRKSEARPGGDECRQFRSSGVHGRMSAVAWRQLDEVSVVEGAMARRSTSSRPGVAGPTMTETA